MIVENRRRTSSLWLPTHTRRSTRHRKRVKNKKQSTREKQDKEEQVVIIFVPPQSKLRRFHIQPKYKQELEHVEELWYDENSNKNCDTKFRGWKSWYAYVIDYGHSESSVRILRSEQTQSTICTHEGLLGRCQQLWCGGGVEIFCDGKNCHCPIRMCH